MKLKMDPKLGEESTCSFKIDIRNLINCDLSTQSLKNFQFNRLLLSKAYILWDKKVQRSYLSWNWRGIQNLERNRPVILTWALKNLKDFHFNGLLLSKVYIVWTKKVERSYLSWNWRGIQNLEENRLVVSKLA